MLSPESSTNTGSEVCTEPRGLNKLLWKEERRRRNEEKKENEGGGVGGGEKNEMASQLVTVGRECESGICCFFDFNQKQRRSAVEKA